MQQLIDGPDRLKWYDIRLACMAKLMPALEYSLTPCSDRQLPATGA